MKTSLIACMFLICSQFTWAQADKPLTFGDVKRWQFKVADQEIRVTLNVHPVNVTSNRAVSVLVVEPVGDFRPRVSEEVKLLQIVLREMSSLQHDPSNLVMINTWLRTSEYREGVEAAVLKSGTWKACTGLKYCRQAEGVADQFLKSVDAFKEFDGVLREYGLRRKGIHVDDMGVGMKAEHIHCAGLIVISLEKEK